MKLEKAAVISRTHLLPALFPTKNILFTDAHYLWDTPCTFILREAALASRLYPGNMSGTQEPDSLHVSGGSNPNAYMPRLQILYGY